jgi:glycosyltransferase involved in cell wall biosynthesis
MLIVTNFSSFPTQWTAASGRPGRSVSAASLRQFMPYFRRDDTVFVVDCGNRLLLELAALFTCAPGFRRPLVAVDVVLRRPASMLDRLALPVRRFLLHRVDHYIHYFKDLNAYQELFGIGPERSSFVLFKPNIRHRQNVGYQPDGQYVLCFGRSFRDYDTFFKAVERLPYPAAIPHPDFAQLRAHGSRFTRRMSQLPKNVTVLDDDGSDLSHVRIMRGARLIVIPTLKSHIAPSGLGTYLNAMILGKCVIASDGPGVSDLFLGEVLSVPPENADALAAAIRGAWEDDELRLRTAAAGYDYATRLGGQSELYQRIIDDVVSWYTTIPR